MDKCEVTMLVTQSKEDKERFNIDFIIQIPLVGMLHKRLEKPPMLEETAMLTAYAISQAFYEPFKINVGIDEKK